MDFDVEVNHCEGWSRVIAIEDGKRIKSNKYKSERGMNNAITHYFRKGYFPGGKKPKAKKKICPTCGKELN